MPPNLTLPGNPRYQPKALSEVFGYDHLYRPLAEVEIATLKTLAEVGKISSTDIALLTLEVEEKLLNITTTEVDDVERSITKHDVRAWVRIAQEHLDPRLRRWVHVPLTSYDALDTARSLQFVRAHGVVRRLVRDVITYLGAQVYRYADTPQIGRTHGQHALPVTVGFWFATFLGRLLTNIEAADNAADELVGKISGAVGAYNAQYGLGFAKLSDEPTFEERVLEKLGLKPGRISTQILPPEPLANYLFACVQLSAAIGQFGRDGRHLMRTEIGELCEPFEQGQVGSSTMAHKRNPITFENLEGMWLRTKNEFGKVLDTMLSEHQRDLVGSSVARDLPIIVVNLVQQLETLLKKGKGNDLPFIARIAIDEEACKRNLAMQGDAILAEPVYIALQMAGYEGDAHELVNHKALARSRKDDIPLIDAVYDILEEESGKVAKRVFDSIPHGTLDLLRGRTEGYIGAAVTKATSVARAADHYLSTT